MNPRVNTLPYTLHPTPYTPPPRAWLLIRFSLNKPAYFQCKFIDFVNHLLSENLLLLFQFHHVSHKKSPEICNKQHSGDESRSLC